MRQQINLFQDALRPKHVQWSSIHLAKIAVVVIGFLVVFEAVGVWQSWKLNKEITDIEAALKRTQDELKLAEVKYPQPQEDRRLVERATQLDEELRQKQQVLGLLNKDAYGNTIGFAEHLTGLAKQRIEGIWLTHLHIDQGGRQLVLSGGSMTPELIPQYLQRLGSEPSFAGKEFKTFQISRTEKDSKWLNFKLDTEGSLEVKQ